MKEDREGKLDLENMRRDFEGVEDEVLERVRRVVEGEYWKETYSQRMKRCFWLLRELGYRPTFRMDHYRKE